MTVGFVALVALHYFTASHSKSDDRSSNERNERGNTMKNTFSDICKSISTTTWATGTSALVAIAGIT